MIEVPLGVDKGKFCFNYLKKNNINFESLSKRTYKEVYKTYDIQNINLFFSNFLNDIRLKSGKFSKIILCKKEIKKINYHYVQWFTYQNLRKILTSNSSINSKFINLLKFVLHSLSKKNKLSFLENSKIFFIFFIFVILKIFKSIVNF